MQTNDKDNNLPLTVFYFKFVKVEHTFGNHLRTEQKHKILLRIFGFVLLIGAMVVLNNHSISGSEKQEHIPVQEVTANVNDNGVTPVAIQIPGSSEAALPIKLISNPNISFMVLCKNVYNLKSNYTFQQLKRKHTLIVHYINSRYLLKYIHSLNNKDIR